MIRYRQIALALFLSFCFSTAVAQYVGPKAATVDTVAASRRALDDTPVVLEGQIIRHVREDKYEFQDKTGKVIIEIDDDDFRWPGPVSAKDLVRVYGEVDRDVFGTQIEVKRIEIVNSPTRR